MVFHLVRLTKTSGSMHQLIFCGVLQKAGQPIMPSFHIKRPALNRKQSSVVLALNKRLSGDPGHKKMDILVAAHDCIFCSIEEEVCIDVHTLVAAHIHSSNQEERSIAEDEKVFLVVSRVFVHSYGVQCHE